MFNLIQRQRITEPCIYWLLVRIIVYSEQMWSRPVRCASCLLPPASCLKRLLRSCLRPILPPALAPAPGAGHVTSRPIKPRWIVARLSVFQHQRRFDQVIITIQKCFTSLNIMSFNYASIRFVFKHRVAFRHFNENVHTVSIKFLQFC